MTYKKAIILSLQKVNKWQSISDPRYGTTETTNVNASLYDNIGEEGVMKIFITME